jgi:hypothetical protein
VTGGRPLHVGVEAQRTGHAAHGEADAHAPARRADALGAARAEGRGGKALHVEEVAAQQVIAQPAARHRIALRDVGDRDAAHVDREGAAREHLVAHHEHPPRERHGARVRAQATELAAVPRDGRGGRAGDQRVGEATGRMRGATAGAAPGGVS